MERKKKNHAGKNKLSPTLDSWYQDLLRDPRLPRNERDCFAYRGVPPQFPGILLTLRAIHLYDLPARSGAEGSPQPYHFPDCPDSTHHLFLHSRSVKGWYTSEPDLTLSLQFAVSHAPEGVLTNPKNSALLEELKLSSSYPYLMPHQRIANMIVALMGRSLVERYIPTIQEQGLLQKAIDPSSRAPGRVKKYLPQELDLGKKRQIEWHGMLEFYYLKVLADHPADD